MFTIVSSSPVISCLQFKLLMEHLDPDEDEEGEGEASANARNKAISALLGGSGPSAAPAHSPRNHHGADSEEDDSDTEDKTPGVRDSSEIQYDIVKYSLLR